jgi:ribosomal protein S18 acetylase RimI-like enzyme
MIIIEPVIEDYPAIAAIYNKSITAFYSIHTDEEKRAFADSHFETAETIATAIATRNFLCAKKGNNVLGYITFRQKNEVIVWISSLYIDPDQQRQGIGKKLLHAVEDFAQNSHSKLVALETHEQADWAIGFYNKNGYIVINDIVDRFPFDRMLDKPPVPNRPILAKIL